MPAVTAGMVILLGLIGMIGWYAGNAVVVQWLTGAAPMQFNTAIGFVLVGLGLLFSLREKSPWARILGGGIMALSILNFMQFIFGVSLGVDEFLRRQDMLTNSLYPGRTSPAASLAFMLAGGAIMVCVQSLQRAWRVQLLWLGGGFLLMLAGIVTVGFIGGWAQIFEWNRDVGMSPPTTLGVFLISLTVLGMANRAMHFDGAEKDWAAAPGIRQSMRIATAAGFGLFLLTLLLWRGWSANEQYVLHRITEANARLARDSVVRRWETHAAQLAALARRTGLNFDVESWPTEAEVYVEHFPSIQALALTDLDTKVISLVPADAAKLLNNRNLTFEADRRNAIARARQTGQPVFSSTAMLMMGGIGVVAFVPIIDSQGNLKGYIEAIYHLDEMATRTLPVDLLQDFNLEILEQDRPIYTNCRGVALDEDRIATSEIQLAGVTWKVRIEPTLARIRETRSPIPEILLLAGLGTAILMGMTTFFAGTAHHRNEALKIAYERVQAESAERTRIAETLETTNRRLETEAVARERMTRELEMHAQLLAQVFENMADGVMVVDTQGRITQVNAATEDIFGVFDRQGDAASWANGVCLEDGLTSLPAERNATLRALRGEAVKREVLFVKNGLHPAGCYFTVGAQPLHDSRKVVTGAVLVFTDITEQRLAALMLQRQNELLEQRVSDRTQDLKRSNAELEQFAYVASHDLQEPLRVVASYLQLLERRYGERLDGDAREFIGFAVDGAQRMKVMINDLLQFSRVNRAPPVRQPVSLQETVERAKGQLQAQIADTGATVEYNGLPTVKGDAVKLVQLFQNLIGNGIKFHGEAPPKVRIEHRRIDAGWEVTVTDNGIGIDPKHAEKVFVIFKRLHGPGSYAGSGIGLSLCKKIVEQHGGRIWVESQEGAGATFHFTLPDAPGEKHDDLG